MGEPITYVDRSVVRPGALPAVKEAVARLVRFVEEREPQLVLYAFHLDGEGSTMTVVAVHPDPESLKLHLRIGGSEFRRMAELIELQSIEIYGPLDEAARSMLDEKARSLGNARVSVFPRQAGFARLPSPPAAEP